ncbi:hypothetical protein [Leptospira santarosai]|uniref:hypothetical protein n=1 Tax=Leptospira santarosai TaxID=28183 RepID=UPI002E356E0D|nr:hypothetical protein [Leptospira santarosai]
MCNFILSLFYNSEKPVGLFALWISLLIPKSCVCCYYSELYNRVSKILVQNGAWTQKKWYPIL